MITLHRRPDSKRADEVQERLERMVAAHRVELVIRPADRFDDLPAIEENGTTYTGDEMEELLREFEMELLYERQFSADACYIDPEDPSRCV